jgi:thiol:disulfide interchange protein DsbA
MGFTTKEIQEQATKAMLIGKSLQQEELMTAAIFAHIHEQGQKIGGINDLKELFVSYDFSEEDFENALKSDEVLTAFTNNNAEIDKFKDDLHSVPNIIINGKYQTKFTKEMTIQDIVDLVNWLSQQK